MTAATSLSPAPPSDAGFSLAELLATTVVALLALGIVTEIFVQADDVYTAQEQYFEARTDAVGALDMIVRLARQASDPDPANPAVGITPDPDNNNQLDSIRIVTDWNPRNGVVTDPYEDITFTVNNGTLFKREPADAAPVPFSAQIASLRFTYLSTTGVPLASPWAVNRRNYGHVTATITTTPIAGSPGRTFSSSASIRRRE